MRREKPKTLYRSVVINYEMLKDFSFSDVPLVSNSYKEDVLINPYDFYMFDNITMAKDAYKNLNIATIFLSKEINLGSEKKRISLPNVGITYKIDANLLDIKKAKRSTKLNEYLDDFDGREWVSDIIPASHYKIIDVTIGQDILHPLEMLDLSGVSDIKEELKRKLEDRKYTLEIFTNSMKNIPLEIRKNFSKIDLKLLKNMYQIDGLKYMVPKSIEVKNVDDMVDYLLCLNFKKSENHPDLDMLKYIISLEKTSSLNVLVHVIKDDIISNNDARLRYLDRKMKKDVFLKTTIFDKKEEMLKTLLRQIRNKLNSKDKEEEKSKVEAVEVLELPDIRPKKR